MCWQIQEHNRLQIRKHAHQPDEVCERRMGQRFQVNIIINKTFIDS